MSRRVVALSALALVSGAASAEPSLPSEPPSVDLKSCEAATAGEVVVCGKRGTSPYRIDPTVLDEIRSKETAGNPARVPDRSGAAEACGTVRNECGGGAVPLLEPALRVVTAVVKAIEGEDWREPFRNGPSDYDRYLDAKQKRSSASIGIGISASSGNDR